MEKLGIFAFTEFPNPHVDPEFGGENVCMVLVLLSYSAGNRTEDLVCSGQVSTSPAEKEVYK